MYITAWEKAGMAKGTMEIDMSATGVIMPPTSFLLDPEQSQKWQMTLLLEVKLFIFRRNGSKEQPVLLLVDYTTIQKKFRLYGESQSQQFCNALLFTSYQTYFATGRRQFYVTNQQIVYVRGSKMNAATPLTVCQIGKLFENAYMEAASIQTGCLSQPKPLTLR